MGKMKKVIEFFAGDGRNRIRDRWVTHFYEFMDAYDREYEPSNLVESKKIDAYMILLKAELEYHCVVGLFSEKECKHFKKYFEDREWYKK